MRLTNLTLNNSPLHLCYHTTALRVLVRIPLVYTRIVVRNVSKLYANTLANDTRIVFKLTNIYTAFDNKKFTV